MYRFTVLRLHPSSPAIRFNPQPSSCSRTIAETSSGISITSPRGAKFRGDPCPCNIAVNLLLRGGSVLHVVRGSVFHVARHIGSFSPIKPLGQEALDPVV